MREHRLPRNREPEPGASLLLCDIRIPDSVELAGRNAFAVVGYVYTNDVPTVCARTRRVDRDPAISIARIRGIENDVSQSAGKSIMVSHNMWQVFVCVHHDVDPWRDRGRRIAHQLGDIYFR